MNPRHFLLLPLGLLLASCASYTPSSAPVPQPEPTEWVVSGSLAVAAEAFSDEARQKAIFDADLDKAEVVAIQVVAENRGARRMLVRPSDMVLQLPEGQKFSPSGITTVVNKVGESGSVIGAAIAFGIIGVIAASNAEEKARTARTADYKEKAFKESTLSEADSAHGFVFFIPPRGTEPFDRAKLRVRFVDIDTATSEYVEVPLAGLAYQGTASGEAKAGSSGDDRVGSYETNLVAQGFKRLNAEEIRSALYGNTVSGYTEGRGNNFAVFSASDGTIRGKIITPSGKINRDRGRWRITDDDMICERWDRWQGDCDRLYLQGDKFVFVNADGTKSSSGVISQGNQKGL